MGCVSSTANTSSIPFPHFHWTDAPHPVRGAGCMFVNETHAIAGIHMHRRNHEVRVCGFGGKAVDNEPWWQTAFRETVQKLFDVHTIPYNLYHALKQLAPNRILEDKETRYIRLVYTFAQLKVFLAICQKHLVKTPLYAAFPRTAEDLVFKRKVDSIEIMLVFWPLHNPYRRFRVAKDFAANMKEVQNGTSTSTT